MPVGSKITSVTPQVYTNDTVRDTANWTKIEGNFTATDNETHITIGNLFTNAVTDTIVTNYWSVFKNESYYLIDDVSVVESGLKANAGPDVKILVGKAGEIGRVGDPTSGL